jgi:endonuclease YncB( thermonuclease family)
MPLFGVRRLPVAVLVLAGGIGVAVFLNLTAWPAAGSGPSGRASVIDADTIEIHGERIRLGAVDAPEASQPCFVDRIRIRCGQRAALALADWIGTRTVSCVGDTRDRYDRLVARCEVGGVDIGSWLVRSGHAVAYRRYGEDYICDEAAAARAQRGIWSTRFVEPATWRRLSGSEREIEPAAGYDPGWPAGCR